MARPSKMTIATLAILLIFMPLIFSMFTRVMNYINPPNIVSNLTDKELVYVPGDVRNTSDYQYFNQQTSNAKTLAMFLAKLFTNPYTLALLVALGLLYTVYERWVKVRSG